MEEIKLESRLRKMLIREGFGLRKSRSAYSGDNLGGYRIVELHNNSIVAGERFDLSLDDVKKFLEIG